MIRKAVQEFVTLTAFDPSKETTLDIDACFDAGFGFILHQQGDNNTMRIIQTGSTSISQVQRNFSVYELELTGGVFAVKKCSRYLHGHQFLIHTDHKPLVGIETKDLEVCKNIRV